MKFFAKAFSTFFGAGFFPVAPGTFASLLTALLYKYLLDRWALTWFGAMIVLIFLSGVATAGAYAKELGRKDPRPIVIDEVCGQLITYILVPGLWVNVAVGFFLFRVFDVIKPYPIRKLENLPRGWGIMADDVLAGVYSAVLLQAYLLLK
jgi:phosphatidylglycerophosphatase A